MQPLRLFRFLPALLAVGLALAVLAPVAAPACAAMMTEVTTPCCCGEAPPNPCPPAGEEAPAMLACCAHLADLAALAPEAPTPPVAGAPVRTLLLAAAPVPALPRTRPPDGPPPPRRPRLALQILQV